MLIKWSPNSAKMWNKGNEMPSKILQTIDLVFFSSIVLPEMHPYIKDTKMNSSETRFHSALQFQVWGHTLKKEVTQASASAAAHVRISCATLRIFYECAARRRRPNFQTDSRLLNLTVTKVWLRSIRRRISTQVRSRNFKVILRCCQECCWWPWMKVVSLLQHIEQQGHVLETIWHEVKDDKEL